MQAILINVINLLVSVITLLVFASVLLSYILSPYHPVRRTVDQIVNPMLAPIRKVIPLVGMIDFSPFILLILVQVIGSILINFISNIR